MDEQLKQRIMIAVVAFNITVIITCLGLWTMGMFASDSFGTTFMYTALVAVPVGAIVAGVAYFVAQMSE